MPVKARALSYGQDGWAHYSECNVEQAATLLEKEGHLPAAAASREAVRGKVYNLREFNERVMTDGFAPWWAHGQLLPPGDQDAVLE